MFFFELLFSYVSLQFPSMFCQADVTSLFCFSSLVTWTTIVYCRNSQKTSGVEDKTLYLSQQIKEVSSFKSKQKDMGEEVFTSRSTMKSQGICDIKSTKYSR